VTRDLHQLSRTRHDLLVIGGGIYGACIAWDAALRGLAVALVEKGDFGHATSSNTLRVIHGGLRYLKSGDLVRFRRSLRERMVFMRIAPHLVRPVPFLIPTYGVSGRGKPLLTLAHLVHEAARFDRPRAGNGVPSVPSGRVLSRSECLRMFPALDGPDLTGAVIVFDGQMVSSERLLIGILKSAASAGAQLANYVEAIAFLRQPGRVTGISARDVLSDSVVDLHARVVVNASGPWVDGVLELPEGCRARRPVAFSKAFNLLVDRPLTAGYALGIYPRRDEATGGPPPAVGTRMLFLTPWRGRTLIGTAHLSSRSGPEEVRVTDAEIDAFLHEVNRAYPAAALGAGDVSVRYAGLLPVIGGGKRHPVQLLTRYGIRDHGRDDDAEGLVSVTGVKFTEARLVAQETVDLVVTKLGRRARMCATDVTPVHGGEISDMESIVEDALWTVPEAGLDGARRLVARCGATAREVLKCVDSSPPGVVAADRLLAAEVRHAVREEMAQTLADVVLRRAELGVDCAPSASALDTGTTTMAEELGWDAARITREVEHVTRALAARRPTP
jgi:glycerol-3-phosphate dehydrogenase